MNKREALKVLMSDPELSKLLVPDVEKALARLDEEEEKRQKEYDEYLNKVAKNIAKDLMSDSLGAISSHIIKAEVNLRHFSDTNIDINKVNEKTAAYYNELRALAMGVVDEF